VAVYFEREGDTELYLTSLDNYARRYGASCRVPSMPDKIEAVPLGL